MSAKVLRFTRACVVASDVIEARHAAQAEAIARALVEVAGFTHPMRLRIAAWRKDRTPEARAELAKWFSANRYTDPRVKEAYRIVYRQSRQTGRTAAPAIKRG